LHLLVSVEEATVQTLSVDLALTYRKRKSHRRRSHSPTQTWRKSLQTMMMA
jgi:hypothetical protein